MASEPKATVLPKEGNKLVVSVLFGLVLGLLIAFIQENMDTSLKTIEDVRRYLGVPLLGVIPVVLTKKKGEETLEKKPAARERAA